MIDKLIKFALVHGFGGLEALSGIPATVGGAIVMNAGAFGHNISDYITSVETLCSGKIKVYDNSGCKFTYRSSRFKGKNEVVVSATFKLPELDREIISTSVKSYLDLRKSIQPSGRSFGSVFKNPKPYMAGALIDEAGLKGLRIGGAEVSDKHANFIITSSKAKAKDVYMLMLKIKKEVYEIFGIILEEEVELIGEF